MLNSQQTLSLQGRYKFKITEISLHTNLMLIIYPTNMQFKIAIFKIYLSPSDEKFWKKIYRKMV